MFWLDYDWELGCGVAGLISDKKHLAATLYLRMNVSSLKACQKFMILKSF